MALVCEHCGIEGAEGGRFCRACGRALTDEEGTAGQEPAPPEPADEIQPLVFTEIWFHPRRAMRAFGAFDTNNLLVVLGAMALVESASLVLDPQIRRELAVSNLISALAIVFSLSLFSMVMGAYIVYRISDFWLGDADFHETFAAVVWSHFPAIVLYLFSVIILLVFSPLVYPAVGPPIALLQVAASLWVVLLILPAVAEVANFSLAQALLSTSAIVTFRLSLVALIILPPIVGAERVLRWLSF